MLASVATTLAIAIAASMAAATTVLAGVATTTAILGAAAGTTIATTGSNCRLFPAHQGDSDNRDKARDA
jgi:hypothetical protein